MQSCCGADIPSDYGDLQQNQFLTAFAIASLMSKAQKDVAKWELVVEKAVMYLERTDNRLSWQSIIERFQNEFFQA